MKTITLLLKADTVGEIIFAALRQPSTNGALLFTRPSANPRLSITRNGEPTAKDTARSYSTKSA